MAEESKLLFSNTGNVPIDGLVRRFWRQVATAFSRSICDGRNHLYLASSVVESSTAYHGHNNEIKPGMYNICHL